MHSRISFASAIAWIGAAKWLGQLLSWASTLIVARLLAPEDYGLVGMATVYLGFVTMVSELGLGLAVVAKPELDRCQLAQLNTLAVMVGGVALAISCTAAFPLASFFESEKLPPVVMVLSTAFLIESLRTIPQAVLQKELQFKYLAFVQGIHTVLVALTMLLFASLGLGYWTLVLGNLLGGALLSALMMAKRPIDFTWPQSSALPGVFTFSRHIVVGRIAWYVSTKVDLVVVGRVLGDAALGVYTVAATIASMPLDKVTSLVSQVATPYFSERQLNKPAMRHLLLTITQALALVTFPAAFGMALVAHDFVLLALGEKWHEVIGPLQLLAGLAAFRSITTVLVPVIIVTGGTRLSMYTGVSEALIMPFVFYAATKWGLEGVAATWLIGYPLFSLPLYVRAFLRAEITIHQYLRSILPALNGSLVMAISVLALESSMPTAWPLAGRFTLEVMVGGFVYPATMWLIYRKRLLDFYQDFRKLGKEERGDP
ncbi:MAG: lipopolysaccharide biosynthesis protein [Gammaproteobacteria bacterium]